MQVLVSVIDDGDADEAAASASASAAEAAAVDAFNDRLRADGRLLFAQGLSADAVVVDARHGDPVVSSGLIRAGAPFAAGFWIWDVPDLDTARTLAVDASRACNRRVELRAVHGEDG